MDDTSLEAQESRLASVSPGGPNLLQLEARRARNRGWSKVLKRSFPAGSTNLWFQGMQVRSGRWSEATSRWGTTTVLAPSSARVAEEKARSRTLPSSWVGRSTSDINTSCDWSSQSAKGSAKVVGPR